MIADGQNRLHHTSGFAFVYRPLTPHQRAAYRRELLDLPADLFRIAIHQIIDRQIVFADWEHGTAQLPPEVFAEVFRVVTSQERDETNLYRGACLALEYPALASTSCASCRHWWWNPLTGELFKDNAGNPVRRQKESVLLCQTPEGCPKGTPDNPTEFTPENAAAFQHYQMAGGQGCPDDELTRRNWAVIRQADEHVRHKRTLRQHPPAHAGAVGRGRQRPGLHHRHV